jgi:hypothetical protein
MNALSRDPAKPSFLQDEKSLLIIDNIFSPASLIALLHEIGHSEAFAKMGSKDRTDLGRYVAYFKTLNQNLLSKEELSDPDYKEKVVAAVLES